MKGQATIESAIIISMMFIILVLFFLTLSNRLAATHERRSAELLQDVSFIAFSEIELAMRAEDGYTRDFSLVKSLRGRDYNLTLINASDIGTGNFSEIKIEYFEEPKLTYVQAVRRNVSGVLNKGMNHIEKRGHFICLNRGECP